MPRRAIAIVFAVMLSSVMGCRDEHTTPTPPVTPPPAPTAKAAAPDPTLKPEQVVKLVAEALGHNDTPEADAGIATAFAFASPGNKQVTGPLARFVPMVKAPTYRPLIEAKTIVYAPIRVDGDFAEQLVTVTDAAGESAVFLFTLSRQGDGDYEDCWMTDGVTRLGAEPIPPEPKDRRENAAPEIRI
jgi:hypothetical protein